MSKIKKSSVELFIEQLEEKGGAWENVSIRRLNISIDVSDYMELKQQAKAMHKEEIKDAWIGGKGCLNGEQYYEQTYGGDK
jgi:hypothetical protein